jgi:hypothetical protein
MCQVPECKALEESQFRSCVKPVRHHRDYQAPTFRPDALSIHELRNYARQHPEEGVRIKEEALRTQKEK